MRKILVAMTCFWCGANAFAFSTFNTSASFGYYKDDQQNSHVPLIYSFSYNGVYSKNFETTLDFFINNDFYINQWSVIPSQATVVIPLSSGLKDAPYKKTRIILGRQFFTEGFDISILDGAQVPIYWGKNGGLWLYGGQAHVLDLLDSNSSSVFGGSIFQDVLGFNLRGGYAVRQNERYAYGSIVKNFVDLPFAPTLISKAEVDQLGNWSQSVNQLQLNFSESVYIAAKHALLKPRKLGSDQNQFIYYVLSSSAEEMDEGDLFIQLAENLNFHGMTRFMRYNTGQYMEWASQQEASLDWSIGAHMITPVFGHITGYGGELFDSGLRIKSKLGDTTTLHNQFSAAYLDKVNNITGWAYQLRTGLGYNLGARWVSTIWTELERNHLFYFDARILANVTYFN